MAITSDVDAPRCPGCSYELTGLDSLTCPECGTALEPDFTRYRPSARPSPWVGISPLRIWRSIPLVLFRPGVAFDRCRSPADLSAGASIAFALIVSLLIIVPWAALKELVVVCEFAWRNGLGNAVIVWRDYNVETWMRLMQWESGSLLRLWLLFAMLVLLVSGARRDLTMGLRRLLLFAPWLIVLDLAFLFLGTFICSCIPEPSTLFFSDWQYVRWQTLVDAFWLKRAALPSFIVGVLFLRYVISMRWRMALPVGLLVYPLVVFVTILWAIVYEHRMR